jgi:hypothetical protein
MKLEIEVSDATLDSIIIEDLKIQIKGLEKDPQHSKTLKAMKKVLKYYENEY